MRGFSADWVIPSGPEAEPIAGGAVVFDEQGSVVAVGEGEALRGAHRAAAWSHERAILLPGLVNAHTHLELSALRGQTRSGGGCGAWRRGRIEACHTR